MRKLIYKYQLFTAFYASLMLLLDTARPSRRSTCVWPNAHAILQAAHGKWRLQKRQRLQIVYAELIAKEARTKTTVFAGTRTTRIHLHLYPQPSTRNKEWQTIHSRDNRPFLKPIRGDTDDKYYCNNNSHDLSGVLGQQLLHTYKSPNGPQAAHRFQVLRIYRRSIWHKSNSDHRKLSLRKQASRLLQRNNRFWAATLRGERGKRLGNICAPSYVCVQRISSPGEGNPFFQPRSHLEAGKTRYNKPTNNGGHIRCQFNIVSSFENSVQDEAVKKIGKYKHPVNWRNLEGQARQMRTIQTRLCIRRLRFYRITATINILGWAARRGGVHETPATTNANLPQYQLEPRVVQNLTGYNPKYSNHQRYNQGLRANEH